MLIPQLTDKGVDMKEYYIADRAYPKEIFEYTGRSYQVLEKNPISPEDSFYIEYKEVGVDGFWVFAAPWEIAEGC